MKVEATKLYDDIKVVVVDPGQECPAVCGLSHWDREGREDCVPLDPEEFEVGEVKEARNMSGVARDSHNYDVECVHIEDAGDFVVGVFDVRGYHTSDSPNPEDWENRKLWIIIKMKNEVVEAKRDALKRHLVGLIKSLSI